MVKLTKSGILISEIESDFEILRSEFSENHCLKLKRFLEPNLLSLIQNCLRKEKFLEDKYKVGDDEAVGYKFEDEKILGFLHFLMNDEKLFKFIEQITGCKKIGCFTGRVYSKIPDKEQYDKWHDDLTNNRMISISINLSTDFYIGGAIQIRNSRTKELVKEVINNGFGDAVIFRVAPYLEHRVNKVYGKVTRTVLTGWFRARPLYKPIHRKKINTSLRKLNKHFHLSQDSLIKTTGDYFMRSLGNQILIYNFKDSSCYATDQIGINILNQAKKTIKIKEITQMLLNEYDIKKEECEGDILSFLNEQINIGLVKLEKQ
ncbi:MAG: 2OG-Fe(II) oxygenase [Candidatus Melainabacteria bacterium]|nr:2OG-Fe(II) oxygenase [Candidatus Melainabacteria bacterium]